MDDVLYPLRILHRYMLDTSQYVSGEKEDGYKKGQSRMWDIIGDAHEPLDGVGIELAELSLDELNLEADLYLNDGNGGEEM
ncbi:hypothetical protein MTR_1g019730 [Medicago truncatula]|uniref:Uncharacterized protein n=1 Tax=Medicago truncatula TaxID=3880 RepID=G7I3N2_MEDTR|nr:hypothetical protein MTR_1g019730 [Medicago truncatula]